MFLIYFYCTKPTEILHMFKRFSKFPQSSCRVSPNQWIFSVLPPPYASWNSQRVHDVKPWSLQLLWGQRQSHLSNFDTPLFAGKIIQSWESWETCLKRKTFSNSFLLSTSLLHVLLWPDSHAIPVISCIEGWLLWQQIIFQLLTTCSKKTPKISSTTFPYQYVPVTLSMVLKNF